MNCGNWNKLDDGRLQCARCKKIYKGDRIRAVIPCILPTESPPAQYKPTAPQSVVENRKPLTPEEAEAGKKLLLDLVDNYLRLDAPHVSREEAEHRVETCLSCKNFNGLTCRIFCTGCTGTGAPKLAHMITQIQLTDKPVNLPQCEKWHIMVVSQYLSDMLDEAIKRSAKI